MAGVTITLGGDNPITVTTDNQGTYTFTDLPDGTYTLTPTLEGFTFSPGTISAAISGTNLTGQDIAAAKAIQTILATLSDNVQMEFIRLEPCTFTMGAPFTDPNRGFTESPQFEATLSNAFYMGKFEVTQGQWEAVVGTRPWDGKDRVADDPDYPVVYISWEDAKASVSKLNATAGDSLYRLPTESEWEYAARAGTTTWPFGDEETPLKDHAWYFENAQNIGERYVHPVGQKQANPWGLHDMHGNAWEWVQDLFGTYPLLPQVEPQGATSGSTTRAFRGGFDNLVRWVRSATRNSGPHTTSSTMLGFRIVRLI